MQELRKKLQEMTEVEDVSRHSEFLAAVTRDYPNTIVVLDSINPIRRYTCLMHVLDFVEKPEYEAIATRGFGRVSSVVTPKPANGGQGKTGQREEAGDSVVLSCRLLWWQVYFRAPTPRTTFEYMTMMEKTIEHGCNGGAISQ